MMASSAVAPPANPLVTPMLTDFYQISMTYAHYKHKRHLQPAVFERAAAFTAEDVEYIKTLLPQCEDASFFEYLRTLDCSTVQVHAAAEGSVVFPVEPLMRISGPLGVTQLVETTLLNLVNFASLVTTNAARFRLSVEKGARLVEFGCRRAQGPDGALSASRYAYVGGFDATSNVLAGKLFGLPISGTHAHAYVQGYASLDDLPADCVVNGVDLGKRALAWRSTLGDDDSGAHEGELAAFVSYAAAFPDSFVALVDTYSTLDSGLKNFCAVALALKEAGHQPVGVRIDSGDLAYLSLKFREGCEAIVARYQGTALAPVASCLAAVQIIASNDLNESVLLSLKEQAHAIDTFGIGTHLVTCQAQPALGCVYKLVETKGQPCIKLSDNLAKMTIPGSKSVYRLIGADGDMLLDLLAPAEMEPPEAGDRVLCRHPFDHKKRVYVTPSTVVSLHDLVFDSGTLTKPLPSIAQVKANVERSMARVRADVLRPLNPTPYKISVTTELYTFFQDIWQKNEPVKELS